MVREVGPKVCMHICNIQLASFLVPRFQGTNLLPFVWAIYIL